MKTAKSTLTHYLTLALREAGVSVDYDNKSEINSIIDDIDDTVRKEIGAAVKPLQERIEQLEKRLAEAERPSAGDWLANGIIPD